MAKRKVIEVSNVPKHRNPIPACVTLGNLIFPSVISGAHPTEHLATDPHTQIKQAFVNMKNIIEAAGGTMDNIAKLSVYLTDFGHREFVNQEWLKTFPNEHDRPARHVLKVDLPENVFVQMDVIAVL